MIAGTVTLFRWQRVRVSGPSMVPTLRDGDQLIVSRGAHVRVGDVVLASFRSMPSRLVLKRAVRRAGDAWWLASDNARAGGDSATHGVADVHAKVIWRLRRGRWPQRVH